MPNAVKSGTISGTRMRLLRFLAGGRARPQPAANENSVLLEGERGAITARRSDLQALARAGLLATIEGTIVLSSSGAARLKRELAVKDPFREQHGEFGQRSVDTPDGFISADVNLSESPLAQLVRRKTKDGQPFLAEGEWRAGERLRTDYTRARIMPRLGANWQAAMVSGRRNGGAGGIAELTDAALAARQRVEHAIEAVGPELSGVLIDICCFLKGLETVEMERGWPARSAKIMLKSALGALSRHYDNSPSRRQHVHTLHWGTGDYRPVLNPGYEF